MRKKCFSMMRRWGRGSETSYGKFGIPTLQTLKYLCQSFSLLLSVHFLSWYLIHFPEHHSVDVGGVEAETNQGQSLVKKLLTAEEVYPPFLKHYSSSHTAGMPFLTICICGKNHTTEGSICCIFDIKSKRNELFYKLRMFLNSLHFSSSTLPTNKQTLCSSFVWLRQ